MSIKRKGSGRHRFARLGFIATAVGLVVSATLPAGACVTVPFAPSIDLKSIPGGPQVQQISNYALTYALGALVVGGIVAIAFAVAARRSANAGGQAGAMETAAKVLGGAVVIGALATLVGIAFSVGSGVTC